VLFICTFHILNRPNIITLQRVGRIHEALGKLDLKFYHRVLYPDNKIISFLRLFWFFHASCPEAPTGARRSETDILYVYIIQFIPVQSEHAGH